MNIYSENNGKNKTRFVIYRSNNKRQAAARLRSKGFTLVEIMIAVCLFAFLFWVFNDFLSHGRRQAENTLQKGDNLREARLSLQWLEKDVRESSEITEYENNDEMITMTLKHVKNIKKDTDDNPVEYDYITYTLYKKEQNLNGKQINPMTLMRAKSDTQPPALNKAAADKLLDSKKDNLTGNPIGVLAESEVPYNNAKVKKESRFFVIGGQYDAAMMLDDTIDIDKKEEMITKATYKADKNGVKGFDDIKKAMAVWIQFSIGDNNKNINYFDQIIYMRSAL